MSAGPSERIWIVTGADENGHPFPGAEVDPDEAAQVAVDVMTTQRMVGGTVITGCQRTEVQPGIWITTAVWWRWKSTTSDSVKHEKYLEQMQAEYGQPLESPRIERGPEPQEPAPEEADPGVYEDPERPPEEFAPLSDETRRDLESEGLPVG